jgi:hypothetical protein
VRVGYYQQGGVLVISLLILLVMTVIGVSAITDSGLQERMVGNQKQVIEASMAAESGAVTAVQWLQAHPESWGDAQAWKLNGGLPAEPPRTPNFGNGPAYWIESIRFHGNTAIIVSRGGVLVADKVMGQSAVMVALQNENYGTDSAFEVNGLAGNGETKNDSTRMQEGVSATAGSMVEITGINAQPAGMDIKTGYDRATVGTVTGHTDHVVTPGDSPRTRDMRGKIIAWRPLATMGAQGTDHE